MTEQREFKFKIRHLNRNLRRPPTRPPQADPEELIQKNLEPLKHNTKKKVAQTLYYQNHPVEYKSPMNRETKEPVHQRLGVKQIKLRRLPLGTNTSAVLPKKRPLFHNRVTHTNNNHRLQTRNTPNQFKMQKMRRIYSAQARLERIRRAHQNNTGNPIKLRRLTKPHAPTNLTVQVKNHNFAMPFNNGVVQQFKMTLDQNIQAEIAEIQSESVGGLASLPPNTRITPVTTDIPMNIRFGEL